MLRLAILLRFVFSSISFLHILYLSFRYEKWSPNGQDYKLTLPKAELLQLKLIHLFARELLLMKTLEIEKTKPTFIISVLKVEY